MVRKNSKSSKELQCLGFDRCYCFEEDIIRLINNYFCLIIKKSIHQTIFVSILILFIYNLEGFMLIMCLTNWFKLAFQKIKT